MSELRVLYADRIGNSLNQCVSCTPIDCIKKVFGGKVLIHVLTRRGPDCRCSTTARAIFDSASAELPATCSLFPWPPVFQEISL